MEMTFANYFYCLWI